MTPKPHAERQLSDQIEALKILADDMRRANWGHETKETGRIRDIVRNLAALEATDPSKDGMAELREARAKVPHLRLGQLLFVALAKFYEKPMSLDAQDPSEFDRKIGSCLFYISDADFSKALALLPKKAAEGTG